MGNTERSNPLPRTVALVVVTLAVAWFIHLTDGIALKRIHSMSPEAYIQRQIHLHQHSYLLHFISMLVGGGFYLGAVDLIAYLIRALLPKKETVSAHNLQPPPLPQQ
jgi:hypothetical protein